MLAYLLGRLWRAEVCVTCGAASIWDGEARKALDELGLARCGRCTGGECAQGPLWRDECICRDCGDSGCKSLVLGHCRCDLSAPVLLALLLSQRLDLSFSR
jgi:hypothetical protein